MTAPGKRLAKGTGAARGGDVGARLARLLKLLGGYKLEVELCPDPSAVVPEAAALPPWSIRIGGQPTTSRGATLEEATLALERSVAETYRTRIAQTEETLALYRAKLRLLAAAAPDAPLGAAAPPPERPAGDPEPGAGGP